MNCQGLPQYKVTHQNIKNLLQKVNLYLDLVVEVCGYGVESGVGAVRLALPVGPLAAARGRALGRDSIGNILD